MISDRLKEMEFKKKDFAELLRISRPTLDKFLSSYDDGKREDVNPRIRKVFDYIEKNELAGKMNVIKFVSQQASDSQQEVPCADENAEFSVIKKVFDEKPEEKDFFELLAKTADFDDIVRYCLKIKDFVRERRLTEEQILMLKPYDDIREIMEKTEQMNR
ncbi:MAG: hypothetical protein IKP49_03780 [Treponema sp.]|nr:hypothetical protein [Treponema sp.]MBR6913871.1 hypothetical protein [Treponema sp.]